MIGFSWPGDAASDKGGGVELWDDGIVVTTACHDCVSDILTDRQVIFSLYHSLGHWLATHPRTVVPPVEDVPHDHR